MTRQSSGEPLGVGLGLQACQSLADWDRGIARYVREHALSILRQDRSMVDSIWMDPDLPHPKRLAEFCGCGNLRVASTSPDPTPASSVDLFHVMSLFERLALDRLMPREVLEAGAGLAVTLYDLIPLRYKHVYLSDPSTRAWYLTRLRTLKQADVILCISETTASDARNLLGIPDHKLHVIYGGVSGQFRPLRSGEEDPFARVRRSLPSIDRQFILYTGGIDFRKNIEALIDAYSLLPAYIKTSTKLVVTCRVTEQERLCLSEAARRSELGNELVLTGYVSDDVLRALYQSCLVFVFPSLYEGLGLPILEAMACGAPVITSNCGAMRELVEVPEACFDPGDPADIARVVGRAVVDGPFRESLREYGARRVRDFTWDKVAKKSIDAYRSWQPRPLARRVPAQSLNLLAICTPYPPQQSGISRYSQRLIEAICQVSSLPIDVVVDGPIESFEQPSTRQARLVHWREFRAAARHGAYRNVVYCLGNSHFHFWMLDLIRTIPGYVWFHDVRMTGLINTTRQRRSASDHEWEDELVDASRGRSDAERALALSVSQQHENSVYLARGFARTAIGVLVNSEFAKDLMTAEAGSDTPIQVLPFAFPSVLTAPEAFRDSDRPTILQEFGIAADSLVIITVGLVSSTKQPDLLVAAIAEVVQQHPSVHLVFVGECSVAEYWARLIEMANFAGIGDRVHSTGWVSEDVLQRWFWSADVAVQLRHPTNGECSASVAECLSNGLPTVFTDQGANTELRAVGIPMAADSSPSDLAREIALLLADNDRRDRLASIAQEYARQHTFAYLADRFLQAITNGHKDHV